MGICVIVVAAAFAEIGSLALASISDQAPVIDTDGTTINPAAGLRLPLSSLISGAAGSFITLILLGVVAAQAFGQDYRHGTIRLTLTIFPRRLSAFFSRAVVMVAVIVATYLIAMIAVTLVALPNARVIDTSITGEFFTFGVRALLYMAGFSLIVLALTVLTRILALGVIIPIVVALVAEPLLMVSAEVLSGRFPGLSRVQYFLPFTAGQGFAAGDEILRNGLAFLAWVIVLLAPAILVFVKRDA